MCLEVASAEEGDGSMSAVDSSGLGGKLRDSDGGVGLLSAQGGDVEYCARTSDGACLTGWKIRGQATEEWEVYTVREFDGMEGRDEWRILTTYVEKTTRRRGAETEMQGVQMEICL